MKLSRSIAGISFLASYFFFVSITQAQHFSFISNTGNNMTVVVPSVIDPTINGSSLETNDEIGVFTPSGLCVGASVWTGSNIAITVWGDDGVTEDLDGIKVDSILHFRLWDNFAGTEHVAAVTYTSGDPDYTIDGLSVLASLTSVQPPVIETDPVSQDKYVGEDVSFFITVSGTAPFTYQWKKDGVPIAAETSSTLDLTDLELGDAGGYTCEATNAAGSPESALATLRVFPHTVTINSPNGGEKLFVGDSHIITWDSEGPIDDVKIELSSNNGALYTDVETSTDNDGSYTWTVPDAVSATCLIRISDVLDAATFDESEAVFAIEAVITVTSPKDADILEVGTTHNITWTTDGTVGDVYIEYSTTNGVSWDNVTTGTTNSGSYPWTVPDAVSTECLIRISELADNVPSDVSNGKFSIVYKQQSISLSGWNMISFNVDPLNDSVPVIFHDIESLVIVKNHAGKIYMPEYLIKDIGTITITEGYKVYLSEDDVLTITGTAVDVSTTAVPLSAGWNMIAYLPQSAMNVEIALGGITTADITLVKNSDGKTYIPGFPTNTLTQMTPGQGYKIHMKKSGSFNYPSSFRNSLKAEKKVSVERSQLSHFTFTGRTGNNMTVIITSTINSLLAGAMIEPGDEIGVYTPDNVCVGGAVWTGKNIAVTVWGDNDQTSQVDGITSGEVLQFRLWDVSAGKVFTAKASFMSGGPEYSVDGIAVLSDLISTDPVDIQQDDPVEETKEIQFFIAPSFVSQMGDPVALKVLSKTGLTDIRFTIYDPLGNVVHTVSLESAQPDTRGEITIGEWAGLSYSGRRVATGTYLVVVAVTGNNGVRKCFRSFVGVKE